MSNDLGPVLSAAYPQVVATLIRLLKDMDRAMDATQDALVKAIQVWESEGIPDNPVAWLVTVGRNRAVDQLRREQRSISIEGNVVALVTEETPTAEVEFDGVNWPDDMLRLLFTCCHPQLASAEQVVLMLKVVLGFSNQEIARGLLASPASIEKRLTRAKQRIRTMDMPYEVPVAAEIPARLDAVLKAIYLLFNEGYTRIQDGSLSRGSLIDMAIRLGRITSRLLRADPKPRALLALMLLSAARLPARVDDQGVFVPLHSQNRHLWHHSMIKEGVALIDAIHVARHRPGVYQIQAAISAIHSQAPSDDDTDWPQIVALYEKLEEYDASPVVPINRAVALCYCGREMEAREILVMKEAAKKVKDYQPYYVALALVFEKTGEKEEVRIALRQARELAQSSAQKVYLTRRIEALGG